MPKYRRGSGSVYLRGKRYWLKYYVGQRCVREPAGTSDRAEARRLLQKRLGELAQGRLVVGADRVTFDALADGVLADQRANGRRSVDMTLLRLRKHVLPYFGGRRAHEITSDDVTRYVARRLAAGAARATVNLELAVVRRGFRLGLRAGTIHRMPHVATLSTNNARQGFFEAHEVEAILVHLPPYLRPAISFAYLTGWRVRSEVLKLQWSNVDLDVGTIGLDVGTTKSGEARLIYMTAELRALIDGQWHEHLADTPACPFVFHMNGQPVQRVDKAWRRARALAGLPDKLMHDTRRSAVRNAVRAGVPERVAMQMTGHKTRCVFDRYHIVADADLREAAARLERAIPRRLGTILGTIDDSGEAGEALTH